MQKKDTPRIPNIPSADLVDLGGFPYLEKKQESLPLPPESSVLKRKREAVEPQVGTLLEGLEGKKRRTIPPLSNQSSVSDPTKQNQVTKEDSEGLISYLKKIALCHKTPFQKKVLTTLCQVPRGQYTTYAAISKHLSSSPRAVGNALKNNPFAPQVPCHRVLASGGGLGGFCGSWGRNGEAGLNDDKKRKLLRDEGVKFDGKGKVVGRPWDGFK